MGAVYLKVLTAAMELSEGTYRIQGLSVVDIAQQFGTPLYVYDGSKIASQIRSLKTAFSGADVKVKYAAKALTNLSILKLIRKHGAGIEVVSLEEAAIAMKAGYTPPEIVFTPSGVGFIRKPPIYLRDNDVMVTEVQNLGKLINKVKVI